MYRSRLRYRIFSYIHSYSKQVKGKLEKPISTTLKILDMSIIVAKYIQLNIAQLKLGGSVYRSIETLVDITKTSSTIRVLI